MDFSLPLRVFAGAGRPWLCGNGKGLLLLCCALMLTQAAGVRANDVPQGFCREVIFPLEGPAPFDTDGAVLHVEALCDALCLREFPVPEEISASYDPNRKGFVARMVPGPHRIGSVRIEVPGARHQSYTAHSRLAGGRRVAVPMCGPEGGTGPWTGPEVAFEPAMGVEVEGATAEEPNAGTEGAAQVRGETARAAAQRMADAAEEALLRARGLRPDRPATGGTLTVGTETVPGATYYVFDFWVEPATPDSTRVRRASMGHAYTTPPQAHLLSVHSPESTVSVDRAVLTRQLVALLFANVAFQARQLWQAERDGGRVRLALWGPDNVVLWLSCRAQAIDDRERVINSSPCVLVGELRDRARGEEIMLEPMTAATPVDARQAVALSRVVGQRAARHLAVATSVPHRLPGERELRIAVEGDLPGETLADMVAILSMSGRDPRRDHYGFEYDAEKGACIAYGAPGWRSLRGLWVEMAPRGGRWFCFRSRLETADSLPIPFPATAAADVPVELGTIQVVPALEAVGHGCRTEMDGTPIELGVSIHPGDSGAAYYTYRFHFVGWAADKALPPSPATQLKMAEHFPVLVAVHKSTASRFTVPWSALRWGLADTACELAPFGVLKVSMTQPPGGKGAATLAIAGLEPDARLFIYADVEAWNGRHQRINASPMVKVLELTSGHIAGASLEPILEYPGIAPACAGWWRLPELEKRLRAQEARH